MENSGVKKDVVSYNALLGGYGRQCEFDEVRRVVKEMKAERVSPNLLTYSTLIDVYSKGGLYKQAMEVFKVFEQVGSKADVVLYTALIDALCKNCLVESAMTLLDEMTKEGIRPNVVTYNSIIDAFGRLAVEHIVDDDSETSEFQSGNLSSRVAENGLVSEVASEGDGNVINVFGQLAVDQASHTKVRGKREILCILGVFQKMHDLKIKPNVVTISAILNACRYFLCCTIRFLFVYVILIVCICTRNVQHVWTYHA